MKRAYSLLIIALMLGGSVSALAYYLQFTPPDCGQPPSGGSPTLHGPVASTIINGQSYWWLNVSFTAVNQFVAIQSVSFQTTSFSDPNFPHLKGIACVAEPNLATQAGIRISFGDGVAETLFMNYAGSSSTSNPPIFTSHTNPTAGLEWIQGTDFLTLLLSEN